MNSCFRIWFLILLPMQLAFGQKVELKLADKKNLIQGANYQIREVLISPSVKPSIGSVFIRTNEKVPVYLQGGLEKAILDYYQGGVSGISENPKGIEVEIESLEIKESFNPVTKFYEGEFTLLLKFNLLGKSSPVRLLDYRKNAKFQRSLNSINQLETLVNKYFEESLRFFDQWIQNQEKVNPNLAKEVQLNFVELTRESTEDTVFYNPARPLEWSDFRDKPNPSSRFNAVIATSFSIQGHAEMVDGKIIQSLEIKVFMIPKQSWKRNTDEYGINHERRHFDLVRIVANQFKKSLESTVLDAEFFQAQIQDAFFEYYRKLNRIQQLYDAQTLHGLNKEAQGTWNLWIKGGLNWEWEAIEKALAAEAN